MGVPSVTSAHFVSGSLILFVISGKAYSYNFDENVWRKLEGVCPVPLLFTAAELSLVLFLRQGLM